MNDIKEMLNDALDTIENLSKEEFREELIKAGYNPKDKVKNLKLQDKVFIAILNSGSRTMDSWSIANKIWNNCMNHPAPGNGVRIAHIRRAAENSEKLLYIPEEHGFSVSIKSISKK